MAEKHKKEDEDIAIDFSKVKNWFKNRKHKEHEHAHPEQKDNLNFNYKDTLDFFKKYSTIFLILIPIIITVYLRIQPMYLPATDDWAQNTVYNYYQNQIATQIEQQYPNLPDANKQALLQTEFQKLLTQNKDMLKQQVDATSQQFKEQMMYESGNSKYVYLSDIDSYYWLRDARRFLNNGTMCDIIDVEKQLCYGDIYTQAPLMMGSPLKNSGIFYNGKLYAYIIAYTYKILHVFNLDMTIMQASFYVPTIFGVLIAILSFLVGKAVSGNIGGLIASVIISSNPIFLSRTMGSDNDPLSIFFPIIIVLFFVYMIQAKDLKKRILFGALTGLWISFYAAAWQGWWFMFDFIIGSLAAYAIFYATKQIIHNKSIVNILKDKEMKMIITDILLLFSSSAIFITIFNEFSRFLAAITGPLWFTRTKIAALETFWPNVLVTVAEFNPSSLTSIIAQMGGKLMFFLGLMGILFVIVGKDNISKQQKYLLAFGTAIYLILVSSYGTSLNPKIYMALIALPVIIGMILLLKSKEDVDVKLAILLVIWFIATSYAALKGVRFSLLMVPAFGVAFGITIAAIYRTVSGWISSELRINDVLTKTIVALLLLLVLIAPVKAGYDVAKSYIPNVNDAWYGSLTKIKENSNQDAIINSWWDFGHWFKYLADRRVTLDGSSQAGPPLHWLGKLMVTDDERLSVGILRMLDCGSNNAFDKLNYILNDTHRSIEILEIIVTIEREDAENILTEEGLTEEQATEVLGFTHCNPPENFFITSEDMVGKAGVWAHFGSWDFRRAEMYTLVKGKTAEEGKRILLDPDYNLTPEQADQHYYEIQTQDDNQWISDWPGFLSGVAPCEKPNDQGMMNCMQALNNQQLPMIINLTNMDVIIPARESYRPTSIAYITPSGTEEKVFTENTLPISVVLIPDAGGFTTIITHPKLANSIFTRLFYLGGHGLRYFDKFDDQRGITGGRIIVWKVDWEGQNATLTYKPVEVNKTIDKTLEKATKTKVTKTTTTRNATP